MAIFGDIWIQSVLHTVSSGVGLLFTSAALRIVTRIRRRGRTLSDARQFPQRSSRRVTLRHEPGVESMLDLERQLRQWEQVLDYFEGQFGFRLQRRLRVFIYASPA